MKLQTVISSFTTKPINTKGPDYSKFVDIFVSTWRFFHPDIDIVLYHIKSDDDPDYALQSVDVKTQINVINVNNNEHKALYSTMYRILKTPEVVSPGGVIVMDIDTVPLNGKLDDLLENYTDDNMVCIRPKYPGVSGHQLAASLNLIADPNIWSSYLNIEKGYDTRVEIDKLLKDPIYTCKKNKDKISWYTDQLFLYQKKIQWQSTESNFVEDNRIPECSGYELGHTDTPGKFGYTIMHRKRGETTQDIYTKLDHEPPGKYISYHIPRNIPTHETQKIIDYIKNRH